MGCTLSDELETDRPPLEPAAVKVPKMTSLCSKSGGAKAAVAQPEVAVPKPLALPNNYNECVQLGKQAIYGGQGRSSRALADGLRLLEHAKVLNPKHFSAPLLLAHAYIDAQRPPSCVDALKNAQLAITICNDPVAGASEADRLAAQAEAAEALAAVQRQQTLRMPREFVLRMTYPLGALLHEWRLANERLVRMTLPMSIAGQRLVAWNVKFQSDAMDTTLRLKACQCGHAERPFAELTVLPLVEGEARPPFPIDMRIVLTVKVMQNASLSLIPGEHIDVEPIQDMAIVMEHITNMEDVDPHHVRAFANPNECMWQQNDRPFADWFKATTDSAKTVTDKISVVLNHFATKYPTKQPRPPIAGSMIEMLQQESGDELNVAFLTMACFRLLKIPAKVISGICGPTVGDTHTTLAVWHEGTSQWVICDPRTRVWGGSLAGGLVPFTLLQNDEACGRDLENVFCFDSGVLWQKSDPKDILFTHALCKTEQ